MFNFSQSTGGRKIGNIWTDGGTITPKYDRVLLSDLFPDRDKRTIYTHATKNGSTVIFSHFKDPRQIKYYDYEVMQPVKAYRTTTKNYDAYFVLWDFGTYTPKQGFLNEKKVGTGTDGQINIIISGTTDEYYIQSEEGRNFKDIIVWALLLPVFHNYGLSYVTRTRNSTIEKPRPLPNYISSITEWQTSQYLKYMDYPTYHNTPSGKDRNGLSLMIQEMIDGGELEELKHDYINIPKGITLVPKSNNKLNTVHDFWGFNYFNTIDGVTYEGQAGGLSTYKEDKQYPNLTANGYDAPELSDYVIMNLGYPQYNNNTFSVGGMYPGPLATGYQKGHWNLTRLIKWQNTFIQNALFGLYPKMTHLNLLEKVPLDA